MQKKSQPPAAPEEKQKTAEPAQSQKEESSSSAEEEAAVKQEKERSSSPKAAPVAVTEAPKAEDAADGKQGQNDEPIWSPTSPADPDPSPAGAPPEAAKAEKTTTAKPNVAEPRQLRNAAAARALAKEQTPAPRPRGVPQVADGGGERPEEKKEAGGGFQLARLRLAVRLAVRGVGGGRGR